MLTLRSAAEIDKMRTAGLYVWHALKIAGSMIRPGVTTGEIDAAVERFYKDFNAISLFKGYPGKVPFPAVTCISVNEEVVHGIPGPRVLVEGDIVGVDTGCKVAGWCADSAITFPVGKITEQKQRLLDVTRYTLEIAVLELGRCNVWSEVAGKMEKHAVNNGFGVVESLVGHGIGREMHEDPQIPNYVSPETLKHSDFKLRPGLVLAVEPMVNVGTKDVRVKRDHWTMVTSDRKPSAHFEHTLALTKSGVRILTGPPENDSERFDLLPYCGKESM